MNPELNKFMDKVKIKFMMKKESAFYCSVLFSMVMREDNSIPTAAVDGKSVFLNSDWILALNLEQCIGLLMHEVGHVIFNHLTRRGSRCPKLWNDAGDHVINLGIQASGQELPPNGLWDPKYKGLSTTEVYNLLQAQQNKGEAPQKGKWGDDIKNDGDMSAEELEALQVHIDDVLIKAVMQADMADEAGAVPGNVRRYVEKLLHPKLQWNHLLQNYMTDYQKEDYSYRRPNRRYLPEYLPSLHSEKLGAIYVAIDTSASVTKPMMDQFIAEIYYIQTVLKPSELTVVTFDTKIREEFKLHEMDSVQDIELTGGGGTICTQVLKQVKKKAPMCSIIITDGHMNNPKINITSDLIWVIYDNPKFDWGFGKIIHIDK